MTRNSDSTVSGIYTAPDDEWTRALTAAAMAVTDAGRDSKEWRAFIAATLRVESRYVRDNGLPACASTMVEAADLLDAE